MVRFGSRGRHLHHTIVKGSFIVVKRRLFLSTLQFLHSPSRRIFRCFLEEVPGCTRLIGMSDFPPIEKLKILKIKSSINYGSIDLNFMFKFNITKL